MARFDVHPNPIAELRRAVPFWLDVQNDFVESLTTRVIVPLRARAADTPLTERLNPAFDIDGKAVFAETQSLVAVPLRVLKRPVASLREHQADIENALDLLFHGY
jgi:toxin CcdB